MEVCTLSRGVMLPLSAQPLFVPLLDDVRFFHPPLPASLSGSRAVSLPLREGYGFTVFRRNVRVG